MLRRIRNSRIALAASLVVVAGVMGAPLTASAGTTNVAAITFVPRGTAPAGDVLMGLLANNGGTGIYYAVAPVTIGENVCKVTLWARDNDGDFNITGRLVRKKLVSGAGTGFGPPPEVMASVATTGASVDLQKKATAVITNPLVLIGYTYWIELDFPGGFMEALSVQVVTKPVC
jgi:hypothetical protein